MVIDIRERLKTSRTLNGYTQESLGEQLHLTRQTISKWETGKSIPDLANLILLSQLYDVSLDELVGMTALSYSPTSIKNHNQRKERFRMLTKGAKITALATAAIFLLAMIGGFLNEKRKWQSVEYADSFLIFGINDVEYENEDGEPQEFFGKIKSLTLKDDTVLLNPTLKDIQKYELNKRGKHPIPMENASEYDAYGLLIDKDDLHD